MTDITIDIPEPDDPTAWTSYEEFAYLDVRPEKRSVSLGFVDRSETPVYE